MSHYEQYIGKVFDERYRIDAVLGVGGMAAVLYAFDLKEQQKVAVKMLREEISDDKQAVRQFITESKAVAMLDHPNIVKILDVVIREETKYIVMSYIEGETLRSYMDRVGVLPLNKTIDILLQILDALDHAHSKGVVHRDIKPQNILMLKNGKVVVTDFGIAKIADSDTVSDDKTIGTVYYISPEQAEGVAIDHRSDIYSLGAMLFEMITGKLPFNADSTVAIALKQINEPTPSPRDHVPTIPIGMEQIVRYAMEKAPENRFQTALQMKAYVEELQRDPFAEFAIAPADQYRIALEEAKKAKKKKEQEEQQALADKNGQEKQQEKESEEEVIRIKGDSWSPIPIMLGILMAFVLVLTVAGFYAVKNVFWDSDLNVFKDNSGENVIIGDFVGKPFTDADQAHLTEDLGYHKVTVSYEHSEVVATGLVISQDPVAGQVRKLNVVELKIVVSLGSNAVENTLPDYTMADYRVIGAKLADQGFKVELIPVKSSALESALILKTEPAAGSKVYDGMTVRIYYSASPNATSIVYNFPEFEGMSETDATYYVDTHELNLISVKYEYSDTVEKGKVIFSSVSKGPKPKLTPLSLVVSLGVDPDTIPMPPSTGDQIEPSADITA